MTSLITRLHHLNRRSRARGVVVNLELPSTGRRLTSERLERGPDVPRDGPSQSRAVHGDFAGPVVAVGRALARLGNRRVGAVVLERNLGLGGIAAPLLAGVDVPLEVGWNGELAAILGDLDWSGAVGEQVPLIVGNVLAYVVPSVSCQPLDPHGLMLHLPRLSVVAPSPPKAPRQTQLSAPAFRAQSLHDPR